MATHVVVIGAGPAGLTAAYELDRLGHGATVLEADAVVGGISRTVNYRGYLFDIGGHRFFSKVPLVNELWQNILGEEMLLRQRLSRIWYGGRFYKYPLKAFDALSGLGVIEAMAVGLSYFMAKLRPTLPEPSFAQWVTNRFGRRLYEIFFKTYTEKVWGIPCDEISAEWAAQRIKGLSLPEAVRNALLGGGRDRHGRVITTLIEQFRYPRLGPGMMWEKCEAQLRQRGKETIRGMEVRQLHVHDGRIERVTATDAAGRKADFGGDAFISSMPLAELIRSLDPPPPVEVLAAADGLRYRDFLTVVLIVRRAKVFPDTWIYMHSSDVLMGRAQNYKNWSPFMVPDPSRTSLGLEYFLSERHDMWSWPDDRLIELGTKECIHAGFIEPGEVEDGTVVRMKKAYPVYDRSYAANVAAIRQYLNGIQNLQCIGRNGQHRYNNQDHSMLTGVYAARNLAGERHDLWSVNVEREYHEVSHTPTTTALGAAGEESLRTMLERVFGHIAPLAFGVAVAVVMAAGTLLCSLLLLAVGWEGRVAIALLSHFLIGYRATAAGVALGTIEAGLLGLAMGLLGAALRNGLMDGYVNLIERTAKTGEREG